MNRRAPAELVAGAGPGEQVHPAAGADRGELLVVADQQELRAGRVDPLMDGGERGGVRHRGLVDDDQVARAQPPLRLVAFLGAQPLRDVPRAQSLPCQDLCGDLRGGEAEDATLAVAVVQHRVCPTAGDRTDHERLPGPRRPDQRLDPRPGRQHAPHGRQSRGCAERRSGPLDVPVARLVRVPSLSAMERE
ncbi:hypothetical protein GCM10023175_50540 [Pseudonocardia xishanensis]|uniref:Uncharacterized protein n=1 Tax=Pseudonocardia xishanensis TaxID=630995 RepID=A0ABP8RYJ4_9PSEU